MRPEERQRLADLLSRIADGDEAAAVTLYREFGEPVRGAVGRAARQMGATHLTREDIEGMAFDVCDDLRHVARAWDPDGGALPWVWAEARVRRIVARHIGQYSDSWDDETHAEQLVMPGPESALDRPGLDLDEDELLRRLAGRDDRCALLREALALEASERDRGVFLLSELQHAMGDPSPAKTVAATFGITHAAARKAVQRVRDRLNRRADNDIRFEKLRDLHIVCRCTAA